MLFSRTETGFFVPIMNNGYVIHKPSRKNQEGKDHCLIELQKKLYKVLKEPTARGKFFFFLFPDAAFLAATKRPPKLSRALRAVRARYAPPYLQTMYTSQRQYPQDIYEAQTPCHRRRLQSRLQMECKPSHQPRKSRLQLFRED